MEQVWVQKFKGEGRCWPAFLLGVFGVVIAVEEATLEQLDGDDGEDEVEQHVDDHDV